MIFPAIGSTTNTTIQLFWSIDSLTSMAGSLQSRANWSLSGQALPALSSITWGNQKILSMEVSIDGSTTKSSIVIWFSRTFIMHFGVPPFMETSIFISRNWGMTILQYGDSSSNSWLSQTVRVLSSENHTPKLWRNSATVEASPQVPASAVDTVDTKKRTMKKLPCQQQGCFLSPSFCLKICKSVL